MRLGIRADSEWATSVTVVRVELDEGPGAQMDMGRGIRARRVAVALELIVARHPRRAPGITLLRPTSATRRGSAGILLEDAHAARGTHAAPLCPGRSLVPVLPVWPAARRANYQAPPDDLPGSSADVPSRAACVRTPDSATMESMPETQASHPPTVLATTLPFFARAALIVDEKWHDLDQMAGVLDRCLDAAGRRERRACFLRADDQRDSGSRTPARADRGGTRPGFAGSADAGLGAR